MQTITNLRCMKEGESITFDLKANNKVRFQKNKDQEYSTFAGEFKRKVKF